MINLKYLTLRGNLLSELNPYWLPPLVNLVELDLAYNDLNEWNSRLLSNNTKLRVLSLFSNRIKYISVSMLEDFSALDYLDISENHLYCTCNTVNYISNYNLSLDNYSLNKTNAKCYRPKTMVRRKVALFIKEQIEGDKCIVTDMTSLVVFCILMAVCILCIGAVGAYYLRYHIRYWIFLFRQAIRFKSFNRKTAVNKYKYDAFVSYSHEDRSFVIRLVTMLETQPPYYKLCVFERDFSVGDIITESVLDCLSVSRRTILVISDSFARSTWCLWEMQLAQHKRLFFKDENNEPLIIVKLGDIMDKHMTPTLRYLIKTRIYLQWNPENKKQKIFWQKLRESLAPPKVQI
ncbi:hypothetical protein O3M35_009465 [Rhynocoris fuscipes]|uniref:TIR domain-containing protein n=1 Tax=Rhynocoris fuscipes TaxID=488301 RepID=A0AAW1D3U1_9HEMI